MFPFVGLVYLLSLRVFNWFGELILIFIRFTVFMSLNLFQNILKAQTEELLMKV